jgi:sec-independent protein translocase protein TatC
MTSEHKGMPFWDHLEELRWRIIKSMLTVMIGAIIAYSYSDLIMYWLISPARSLPIDLNLQVLKITSMFTVKLSVAIFGGMVLGLPIILYQFWRFVSPAFENQYALAVFFTVLFSSVFFILGMGFAYFIIIPFSLNFFTSLASDSIDIAYNFTLEGYLTYILWLIFGCGLIFQLPIVSIFFTKIGILTPAFLRFYRKFAIVAFLILGAILTPPDPVSQILIVIPLILLYEFSIIISKFFKPKDSLV